MTRHTVSNPYEPRHALYGCQLKLRRAQHHADTLQNLLDAYFGREPYKGVYDFDAESGHHVVRFKIRERPSPEWSLIIGDFINNLRSALDHLAWQLVIRNERNPKSARPQFPIFLKDPFDKNLYASAEDAERARKSWRSQTRGMHEADVAILKGMQPYEGTQSADEHPLARLSQFSNWDKHRELHFATQAFMGNVLRVKDTTTDALLRPIYFAPKRDVLEDGDIIARFERLAIGPNPNLDVKLQVILDITFGEGSPLEGLGVKQTLIDIAGYVYDVIFVFKDRFDRQDFSTPPELLQ